MPWGAERQAPDVSGFEVVRGREAPKVDVVSGDERVGDADAAPVEVAVVGHPCSRSGQLSDQFVDGAVRLFVGADQWSGCDSEAGGCLRDDARVLT